MIYLYTGRKAVRIFDIWPAALFYDDSLPALGTLDQFLARLRKTGADYVVDLPMPGFPQAAKSLGQLLEETRQKFPACLTEVFRPHEDPRFAVYETRLEECGR